METQTPPLSWKRDRPREAVVPRTKRKDPITPEEEARKARVMAEASAAWEKRTAEAKDQVRRDRYALQAIQFRETWNELWSDCFGDLEDTNNPAPPFAAFGCDTLQIFSVKVTGVGEGLQWPLHVFGIVALRDAVDNNRNVIFYRKRENYQILTQKDPCLALTGPTRAVVMLRPVTFKVKLTVKGATESEDKELSYLAVPLVHATPLHSCLLNTAYTSKLSTLEFTHDHLCYSVRVIDGSWNGSRCQFFACTASINEEVLLLDSGDEEVPVSADGKISLSREVVSVELEGKLMVYVKAWDGDVSVMKEEKDFTPKKAGRNRGMLNVGSCKMQVTVSWSLISTERRIENSL